MREWRFWNFFVFQTTFAYPSAQGVVGVGPSFFCAVFFEDFGFDQLVMQVVEIVLYFAVGEFAVDEVAELVVVIGRAVVGFQAVVGDGIEVGWKRCGRFALSPTLSHGRGGRVWFDLFRRDVEDIVRRIEGEPFVTRLGNPAQFVVLELGRSRPLVGAVGQVAGAVVAVAAFDRGLAIARRYFGFAFTAFRQIIEGGDLFFQTT